MAKTVAKRTKGAWKKTFGLLATLLTLQKNAKRKRWDHWFSSIYSIYIYFCHLWLRVFFAGSRGGVCLYRPGQKCQKAKRSQGVI